MLDRTRNNRLQSVGPYLLKSILLPASFALSSCDKNLPNGTEKHLESTKQSIERWKSAQLSQPRAPTPLEKSEYTAFVDKKFLLTKNSNQSNAIRLNERLTKELIFDLLKTTEKYCQSLPRLMAKLQFKAFDLHSQSFNDPQFMNLVESNYREAIKDPKTRDLLQQVLQITTPPKCTECALTYLATFALLTTSSGIDIADCNIELHTGLYIDLNDPLALNGVGHMWLEIDGKIYDPAAEPNTLILEKDNHKYMALVGGRFKIDSKNMTIDSQPLIFTKMEEN